MERKRQICMKGGRQKARQGERTASCEKEKKKYKAGLASHLPIRYFHISAVRQQLFSSSVAPNRFHVSDIGLRRIIAPAKLIRFPHIHTHAERRHFSRPLFAGRLIPTCRNLFSSTLPAAPPLPDLLCHSDSVSLSFDAMQCHHTVTLDSGCQQPRWTLQKLIRACVKTVSCRSADVSLWKSGWDWLLLEDDAQIWLKMLFPCW